MKGGNEMRLFKRVVNSEAARRQMTENPDAFVNILKQRKYIRNQPHVVLKLYTNNDIRRKKLNEFIK